MFKENLFSHYTKLSSFVNGNMFEYCKKNSVLLYYSDFNKNWGDYINPYLLNKILNMPVVSVKRVYNFLNKDLIFGIGSILKSDLSNAVIWGSGFIKDTNCIVTHPKQILALRGKKTAEVFRRNKIDVSGTVFGDPALLFPLYFEVKYNVQYELGIIPHYTELNNKFIIDLKNNYADKIKIISPLEGQVQFAQSILSCEKILSSSLHGLILSDAYKKPTSRIVLSDRIIGGNFKFDDYYSGVGIDSYETINLVKQNISFESLRNLPYSKNIVIDSSGLIEALNKYMNSLA